MPRGRTNNFPWPEFFRDLYSIWHTNTIKHICGQNNAMLTRTVVRYMQSLYRNMPMWLHGVSWAQPATICYLATVARVCCVAVAYTVGYPSDSLVSCWDCALSVMGSRVWPFGVTWRHRSRDHLIAYMPFPMWSIGTKPLSVTVSEIFNVECNAMVDMTLIRPLNKGQGHLFWY